MRPHSEVLPRSTLINDVSHVFCFPPLNYLHIFLLLLAVNCPAALPSPTWSWPQQPTQSVCCVPRRHPKFNIFCGLPRNYPPPSPQNLAAGFFFDQHSPIAPLRRARKNFDSRPSTEQAVISDRPQNEPNFVRFPHVSP